MRLLTHPSPLLPNLFAHPRRAPSLAHFFTRLFDLDPRRLKKERKRLLRRLGKQGRAKHNGFHRIRTHGLSVSAAVFHQLSCDNPYVESRQQQKSLHCTALHCTALHCSPNAVAIGSNSVEAMKIFFELKFAIA